MSLSINIHAVTAVMIGNEWHEIEPGTFDLDSYEFEDNGSTILEGGSVEGISHTGYTFTLSHGATIAGPLTAIQAIRYR